MHKTWIQTIQSLKYAIDSTDEAVKYDENTTGVYLYGKELRKAWLVTHLPIKISKLTKRFLNAGKNTVMIATVFGKKGKWKLDLSSLPNTEQWKRKRNNLTPSLDWHQLWWVLPRSPQLPPHHHLNLSYHFLSKSLIKN